VFAFANQVGHVAERENIRRAIEREAVVKAEAYTGLHFFEDREQTAVFDVVSLHLVQARAPRKYISAAQNRKNNTLT